jgi:hypothetical protein
MDDQHVLALVEAVGADLHAIHGFALDAIVGDNEGHGGLLAPISKVVTAEFPICPRPERM